MDLMHIIVFNEILLIFELDLMRYYCIQWNIIGFNDILLIFELDLMDIIVFNEILNENIN